MAIAVLIVVLIFYLPILFKELRQNKSVLLTYFFVVILHQLVAVINAFCLQHSVLTWMHRRSIRSELNCLSQEICHFRYHALF